MIINRWTPIDFHRDCPHTKQVESGCRIAPEIKALPSIVTLSALPAGDDECVTFDFPSDDMTWREQIVEEAIREDAKNGR